MEHNEHLYEKIYYKLLDKINSGEIKDGEKLPSEKELTEQFGVSRITTQKAMNMLADQGIIVRRPRLGSFVQAGNITQNTHSDHVPESPADIKNGQLIGLVIEDFTDSYGIEILRAVEYQTTKLGYHLCIKRSLGQQSIEKTAIDQLLLLGVGGILIMPTHGDHYNTQILRLVIEGFPIVFIDRYLVGIPASYVGTNNRQAAEELTNYLIDRGHTDIAIISTPGKDAVTLNDRIEGFADAHKKRGINLTEDYILDEIRSTIPNYSSAQNRQGDMDRIERFLRLHDSITAVFTTEYLIADMVKTVCGQMGKVIPGDISVVCFDGPASDYKDSFFTHMRQDEQGIGEAAINILHTLVHDSKQQREPVYKVLDAALAEGRSVKNI